MRSHDVDPLSLVFGVLFLVLGIAISARALDAVTLGAGGVVALVLIGFGLAIAGAALSAVRRQGD